VVEGGCARTHIALPGTQTTRLENASWRKFFQTRFNLATISPAALNWEKTADIVWLYGPFHTYEPLPELERRYLDRAGGVGAGSGRKTGPKSSLKKRKNSRHEFVQSIRKQQAQLSNVMGEPDSTTPSGGAGSASGGGALKRVESDSRLAMGHRVAFSFTGGGTTSSATSSAETATAGVLSVRPARAPPRVTLASSGTDTDDATTTEESDSSTSLRAIGKLLRFQVHEIPSPTLSAGTLVGGRRKHRRGDADGSESDDSDEEDEDQEGGISFSIKNPRSTPPVSRVSTALGVAGMLGASMLPSSNIARKPVPAVSHLIQPPDEDGTVPWHTEGYGWIDRLADAAKNVRDVFIWAKGAVQSGTFI
jgi:hypothetical protein